MTESLFLSPHNDDECLFGCYSLLRYQPCVVVVLRSRFQDSLGVSHNVREKETARAMALLGCDWEQWGFGDVHPDWVAVEAQLRRLDRECRPERVFAPAPAFEANGHRPEDRDRPLYGVLHHDMVGWLAGRVFGGRVTGYLTYTRDGGRQTDGERVPFETGWPERKREALACYESQRALESTAGHFDGPLDEYYARTL